MSSTRSPTRRAAADRRRRTHALAFDRLEGRAVPATFSVTSLADDGAGSFRQAIQMANDTPGADMIDFDASARGTISLLSALPDLASEITIDGPGAADLTITNGNLGNGKFRLLRVTADGVVDLSGLTLRGGSAQVETIDGADRTFGGAVLNLGMLSIADTDFFNNTASPSSGGGDAAGGAIANLGTLTVTGSKFATNQAVGQGGLGYGGAIANGGTLTIAGSTFAGNFAIASGGGSGIGGAIANGGTMTVNTTTFLGNVADDGGAISNNPGGSLGLTGSAFTTNKTTTRTNDGTGGGGQAGGAIITAGPLTVADTTFTGNEAVIGGGIAIFVGSTTIDGSTFTTNIALGQVGVNVYGGAIVNGAMLDVTDSTFTGNMAVGRSSDPNPDTNLVESVGFGYGGAIANGGTATINGSTLEENSAGDGGAISNHPSAMLTIRASTLRANTTVGVPAAIGNSLGIFNGNGAGIINAGTLDVGGTGFADNRATGNLSGGGGIASFDGELTVADSTFTGNSVLNGGSGGGMSILGGTATVDGSTFTGNFTEGQSQGSGGGIAIRGGTTTITGSTLSGNTVGSGMFAGSGGGIWQIAGTSTVTGTTIEGNTAGSGGGLDSFGGAMTLRSSTVRGNSAASSGGGILNSIDLQVIETTIRDNQAVGEGGSGGGIFNNGGQPTITRSTLSGNSAGSIGGGIFNNAGSLTITNSTLSGNSAGRDGGGIFNNAIASLTVTASTLAGNSAESGGGIAVSFRSSLTIQASIFANPEGGNFGNDPGEVNFTSLGNNLFTDTPVGFALAPTDLVNTDPMLGPLADNGGPTFTQALPAGSPAIDASVAIAGVTTDQRGITRPQGSAPDIGAFELEGAPA